MKNSIKTTLSVLLLGLASTAAFAATPVTSVAANDVQSVQLTSSKAIMHTKGGELAGIYDIPAETNAPVVVTTTTPAPVTAAIEVAEVKTPGIITKGDLLTGRYETAPAKVTEKATETKATDAVEPQAANDSESFILKSLKN